MKTTIIKMLICFSLICLPLMSQAQQTLKTRIGDLSFTHDFEKGRSDAKGERYLNINGSEAYVYMTDNLKP